MPVVGIGMDIVSVPEFAEQVNRPGTVFVSRVFTAAEVVYCAGDTRRLAARWAAKEALLKAWSVSRTGPPEAPEGLHSEIEVVNDAWGRPSISLTGTVADCLDGVGIHVTLTHDGALAAAMVVLER